MKNKFAVLLQIVFIYFSWQQGQRLLSGLFTRCSQRASLGPRSFNFMLLKLRLIFIWWQELLSAGLDVVAGLKEFLSDVQSAGVKPLWETARGRQNSAQSTTGEEGDKPPGSWRPAPHSPAEDMSAVKTVFVFTPQSFVLGQTQSQVWGAAAPFHYRGNTSHR